MQFRGLDISWKHILDVYEWDFSSPSSLRMLHKLTEEHLHLTPALRMKVKLAAQVCQCSYTYCRLLNPKVNLNFKDADKMFEHSFRLGQFLISYYNSALDQNYRNMYLTCPFCIAPLFSFVFLLILACIL